MGPLGFWRSARGSDVDPDEFERRLAETTSQSKAITLAIFALMVGCFLIGFARAALGH